MRDAKTEELVKAELRRILDAVLDSYYHASLEGRPLPPFDLVKKTYGRPRGPFDESNFDLIRERIADVVVAGEAERAAMSTLGRKPERRGVPPETKKEIAWLVGQGEDPAEIGRLFGYGPSDVLRIAASLKVKPPADPPRRPTPVPTPATVEEPAEPVGPFGIVASLELQAREALRAGKTAEQVADELVLPLAAIQRIEESWRHSIVEIAAAVPELPATTELDPTTEGENLLYVGRVWRVEVSPPDAKAVTESLEDLKEQTVKQSSSSEYEVILRNLTQFADGVLGVNVNTKRLKYFRWKDTNFYEFKGHQGRAVATLTTSKYPGGVTVKRCAIVYAIIKKRDNFTIADLDYASAAIQRYQAWREAQDEKISKIMERPK